ncbi:MAG: anti-sigma factor, partial [Hyphomicrobiaceae bacterium]
MADTDNITDEDTPEDLAAEYALGTLDAAEMFEAEQRIKLDPAFARDVAAWQEHLAPLLDAIPEVAAPEGVFYDVQRALGRPGYNTVQEQTPTQDSLNILVLDEAEQSMRTWRRLAALSGAIAASLLTFVFLREVYQPQLRGTETYVAVLESDGREPAFVATVDLASGSVAIHRVGSAATAGKSHQLWAIGGGRVRPQSLGVIEANASISPEQFGTIAPDALRQTVFAISLEPVGGSLTGQPTGPVLF